MSFLTVVIGASFLIYYFLFSAKTDFAFSALQGQILIWTTDAGDTLPIRDAKYTISDKKTGQAVAEVIMDETGSGITEPLPYGYYTIVQSGIDLPYELYKEVRHVSLFQEIVEVEFDNAIAAHITSYERTADRNIRITGAYITVPPVLQLPELPHGCEITSATAVLHALGYGVSKTTMADRYLPKEPFVIKNKKRYGADPYKAYAGNPHSQTGGFFTYAPPVVQAVNDFLADNEGAERAYDRSGSTKEEILAEIHRGVPVVMWVTLDLTKPILNYSWYFHGTDTRFVAPTNLHAVVLMGYDGDRVHVMNPLKGEVTYTLDAFFESYVDLGSHALIIE